jgi:hypothetical protein
MNYRKTTLTVILALILGFTMAHGVNARIVNCTPTPDATDEELQSWIRLQVGIPSISTTCTEDNDTTDKGDDVRGDYVKDMGQYIGGLYKYFVSVIGIIAALMVFYGGLRWLSAGGNASRVKEAKETIFAALIAILIAFGSYTLLYTINRKLVDINPPVLKLVDTFLVSFDNFCPTQKICLSGSSVGRSCTDKTNCGGIEGSCGFPFTDESGNEVAKADCGTRYKYKKIVGVQAPSETCLGGYCGTKTYAIGGTVQLLCLGDTSWSKQPVNDEPMSCKAPSLACDAASEKGASQSSCSAASFPGDFPGAGKCQYVDTAWYNPFTTDQCVWGKPLTCDTGYVRVGCGTCTNLDVSCTIPNDGTLITLITKALSGGICDAVSAKEVVYALDLTADKKNTRSICCQRTVCIGGTDADDACTVATDCNSGVCGPKVGSTDKSDFSCITTSKP